MKSILYWFVLIVSIAVLVSSCASSDDSKTASTDNTSSSEDSSTTTALEGTWVVSCFDDGGGNYLIKTLTVTGTEWVDKIEIHTDSSCATDKDKWEFTWGSLQIGETGTHDGSPTAKFTMTLGTSKYTPQTSALVSSANTNSWCGETDWVLNTAQSAAGKTCGSGTQWDTGQAVFGEYILDGNNLYWDYSSSEYPSVNTSSGYYTFTRQ